MTGEDISTMGCGDKLVLVTGSAKRLGAAIALHFAQSGYDVIVHYNNSKNEPDRSRSDKLSNEEEIC